MEQEAVFVVPPFIDKAAPAKEVPSKEESKDPFAGDMLNTQAPNYKKRTANLHYMSEVTGEYGTLLIRPGMTDEDIMNQYAKLFPRECAFFLREIKDTNESLHSANGMSEEKRMMALTKIPQLLFLAMKFIDENYWADKQRYYRFIRKFPKFMIGDHHRRTRGAKS